MTTLNPFKILKSLPFNLVVDALRFRGRTAREIVRAEHPTLKGVARWKKVAEYKKWQPTSCHSPESFCYLNNFSVMNNDEGILLAGDEGFLKICVLEEGFFLLRAKREDHFKPPFSYGVVMPPSEWKGITKSEDFDDRIIIHSGDYSLQVSRSTGELTLASLSGDLLSGGKIGMHPGDEHVIFSATRLPGMTMHGLGEQAFQLDLSDNQFDLNNTDPSGYERGTQPIYLNMPVVFTVIGGQALMFFFDNTYRAFVDFGKNSPQQWWYQAVNGEMRLYLIAGSPAQVLEKFTRLSGRIPLPPRWALGLHQSRWSYYPQSRVEEVISEFRKRRIPCDVIHFDIHYMDDYRCFTWDHDRFPDLPGLLEQLHVLGFKGLSLIDPGIKVDRGFHVYDQGIKDGHFLAYRNGTPFTGPVWPGNCHFPDFTSPATREWWGTQYKSLLDLGMDAFWNDMNEIALITSRTGTHVPDEVRLSGEERGADYGELHAIYGMQMARASVEGLMRLNPEKRPLILTRSGWAGVQRYAFHWTGDNASTFDHLRLSISMVMNLGLCGISMTGPDVGGFNGTPTPELFARWIQAGAFTPFFRIHTITGSPDQEPWSFGPEVEEISRRYISLRYQLLPYIYTAVWQASETGKPVMRPLGFDHPGERNVMLDDEYYFGDSFIVAPVTQQGARERQIYLPEGEYYDFWSGEHIVGPVEFIIQAELDHLPLYVKAGAVIPFFPTQQYIGEKHIGTLTLKVYTGKGHMTSYLYDDDGKTPATATSFRSITNTYTTMSDDRGITISKISNGGGYKSEWNEINLQVIGLDSPEKIAIRGISPYQSTVNHGELHILFPDSESWSIRLNC